MKQIDSSQLLERLIKEKEGNNISAAARKLNISSQRLGQYVRGVRTPNVEFVRKWKEVYGDDLLHYTETPIETNVSTDGAISFREHLESIKEQKRMAEQYAKELKEIIIAQLTTLDHKLTAAGKNLDGALAAAFRQSLMTEAVGSTVLESLARLEKRKPDSLVREAGKKLTETSKKAMQQGTNYVENR